MFRWVGFLLVPGCMMEAVLWPPDTGKGADVEELREYECQPGVCSKTLVYDIAALEACYLWDPVTGWSGYTQHDIADRCVPGTMCEIEVASDTLESWNPEGCDRCVEGTEEQATPPECCFTEVELEESLSDTWASEGTEIEGQVLLDCGIAADVVIECEMGALGGGLGEPCPPDTMRVAEAEYALEIDSAASFVTLSTAAGSVTARLAGTAAVASRPAEVLVAIVDAQDPVSIAGRRIDDLRFWFSNDILLDSHRGTFSVPDQGAFMSARGKLNGGYFAVQFEPTASASGAFDASRWNLDYTSTFPEGQVDLHLEGPLHASSL